MGTPSKSSTRLTYSCAFLGRSANFLHLDRSSSHPGSVSYSTYSVSIIMIANSDTAVSSLCACVCLYICRESSCNAKPRNSQQRLQRSQLSNSSDNSDSGSCGSCSSDRCSSGYCSVYASAVTDAKLKVATAAAMVSEHVLCIKLRTAHTPQRH
jgi:hypothetical protein